MSPPSSSQASGFGDEVEVRAVQPYQARKAYVCPGCNQHIPLGVAHVVVVPVGEEDLRRHWHRPCWERRLVRRPTGRPRPAT